MEYVRLGQSGLKVSRLCLGTMNMGTPNGSPGSSTKRRASRSCAARSTPASTSSISRISIRRASARSGRPHPEAQRTPRRAVVTTKVGYDMGSYPNAGGHSRKHVLDGIDGSPRLGMDYVDIFMLHFFDVNTPVEETMSTLHDIVRAGKARYIGVSTMYTWQFAKIMQACERNGWDKPINMQLQLNLAYREEEREMVPYCID